MLATPYITLYSETLDICLLVIFADPFTKFTKIRRKGKNRVDKVK